jgi:hypothetical protein
MDQKLENMFDIITMFAQNIDNIKKQLSSSVPDPALQSGAREKKVEEDVDKAEEEEEEQMFETIQIHDELSPSFIEFLQTSSSTNNTELMEFLQKSSSHQMSDYSNLFPFHQNIQMIHVVQEPTTKREPTMKRVIEEIDDDILLVDTDNTLVVEDDVTEQNIVVEHESEQNVEQELEQKSSEQNVEQESEPVEEPTVEAMTETEPIIEDDEEDKSVSNNQVRSNKQYVADLKRQVQQLYPSIDVSKMKKTELLRILKQRVF